MRLVIVLFIVILFFNQFIFSDEPLNRKLISKTVSIISENLLYVEGNPSHMEESEEVNNLIQQAIAYRFTDKDNLVPDIQYVFNLLYNNAYSSYEDMPDVRRMKTRLCLIFTIISLLSDEERGFTFLKYARYSLKGANNLTEEFLESKYLVLLLLELIYKYEYGYLYKGDVDVTRLYLTENKDSFYNIDVEYVINLLDLFVNNCMENNK